VLADAEAPGQSVFEEGARVSAKTSQRFTRDASRVVMEHDADGGERCSIATAPAAGPTTLSNLVLLCRRYHRAVVARAMLVQQLSI
jgi:hypothetical protein